MKGVQTILLIDDQDEVQDPMSQALRKFGFEVLNATDGQQGIELFDQHQRDIDLVIADIKMPVENGVDAAKDIRKINALVPVIFITGKEQYEAIKEIGEFSDYYLMIKPFSLVSLRDCILTIFR